MRDTTKQAERLAAICLRYTINTHLEDRGVTRPAAIGAAAGLLTRRQWRAGDVAALRAVAARLGLEGALPELGLGASRAGER